MSAVLAAPDLIRYGLTGVDGPRRRSCSGAVRVASS